MRLIRIGAIDFQSQKRRRRTNSSTGAEPKKKEVFLSSRASIFFFFWFLFWFRPPGRDQVRGIVCEGHPSKKEGCALRVRVSAGQKKIVCVLCLFTAFGLSVLPRARHQSAGKHPLNPILCERCCLEKKLGGTKSNLGGSCGTFRTV
eukprot:m.172930 g.172930  ORF g.172930 m.172930 type:complete len:147 (-) comp21289_c0_seq3:60-500(-)